MLELKRLIIGRALNRASRHERLSKKTALAVFSPTRFINSLSTGILLVLAVAAVYVRRVRSSSRANSIGIGVLLIIVTISYRKRSRLPIRRWCVHSSKRISGQSRPCRRASLLVDYVLTVAVSIAAGVAAITSMVQGPATLG